MYNILLPVFLLVWFPSWLWLLLIPANYLIDRFVLRWGLPKGMEDRKRFLRKHTWKICLAGFLSDFAGSLVLFGVTLLTDALPKDAVQRIGYAVSFNPFEHPAALAIVLFAVALAGVCIFLLDRGILKRAGMEKQDAKRAALRLALVTAPYLFLFPSILLYR
ncbi:MAG: hypothetical protein IKF50_07755 [Clostridia bacterium]|nr:hypothetical protein [Clostridia bacterium]